MKRIENIAQEMSRVHTCVSKETTENSEYFVSGRRKLTFDISNLLTLGK